MRVEALVQSEDPGSWAGSWCPSSRGRLPRPPPFATVSPSYLDSLPRVEFTTFCESSSCSAKCVAGASSPTSPENLSLATSRACVAAPLVLLPPAACCGFHHGDDTFPPISLPIKYQNRYQCFSGGYVDFAGALRQRYKMHNRGHC